MTKERSNKSVKQALRFTLVGAFNTFLDAGIFYLLYVLGLHKALSQVCATGVAMCSSFLINRFWTFEQRGKGNVVEVLKFVMVNLVSMTTVILLTYLFYDLWHVESIANFFFGPVCNFRLSGDLAVLFCKLCASALSILINFFGNKFWVFGTKK